MSGKQKSNKNKQSESSSKISKPKEQKSTSLKPDQFREAPETLQHEDVLAAQQQVGNQVVQRSLSKKNKRETNTDGRGYLNADIAKEIQQKRGGGNSLPSSFKEESEKKFGNSFEDVRIHNDEKADRLAKSINARAFTIGKDIFFKKGAYSPTSSKGRETLIHELTHVVQQSGSVASGEKLRLGGTDTAQEKEANKISKQSGEVKQSLNQVSNQSVSMQPDLEEEEMLQMQEDVEEDWETDRDEEEERPHISREQMQEHGRTLMDRMKGKKALTEDVKAIPKGIVGERREELEGIPKAPDRPGKDIPVAPPLPGKKVKEQSGGNNLAEQIKSMGLGSDEHMAKLGKIDESTTEKSLEPAKKELATKKSLNLEKKASHRSKLLAKMEGTKSSQEDVVSAKEELNSLHNSKSNKFKKLFGKDQASKSLKKRKSALKAASERGEEGAFEKYKDHKAANPSKKSKVGGFFKKAGGKMVGGLKSLVGKQVGDLKDRYLGKSESKDAPSPSPAPVSINMVGGGGGGMAEMMEKYSELKQENERLNEKLKEKDE